MLPAVTTSDHTTGRGVRTTQPQHPRQPAQVIASDMPLPGTLAIVRRTIWLAVLTACLCGFLATAAIGVRPATEQETGALAPAVGLPPGCIAAHVSTADESWAGVTDTNAAGCAQADGIVVLRLVGGTWMQVTAGSSFGTCPVSGVPTPVAKDFKICRDPRTIILCANRTATERLPRVAPSRCDTLGPRQSFSEGSNLARLRWSGWGHAVASATGVELGYHLPFQHVQVHVRAYALRRQCGEFDNLYTKLRIRSRYGTTVVSFPVC
jgi:hypothetical protein